MSTELENSRLTTLGVEIRLIHERTVKETLRGCIEIGERLTEAKSIVQHGGWGEWLTQNVGYSQRQANNYMSLYAQYGGGQLELGGRERLPESIEKLGITKALALLAVPEDDREEFVEAVGAEELSVRALKKEVEKYKQMAAAAEERQEELEVKNSVLTDSVNELSEVVDELTDAVEELRKRPVEVAVQEPSEEQMQAIREEAERVAGLEFETQREALRKRLEDSTKAEQQLRADKDKALADLDKAKERLKKAKDDLEKSKSTAKAEAEAELKAAQEAKEEAESAAEKAEARATAAEKALKAADQESAQMKILLECFTSDFSRICGLIKKAPSDKAEKFRAAVKAALGQMQERL